MGGVPRSRGCSTCKARKIKCDETWPTCIQCRSQGAVCPGPTTLVKFVNAKSHPGGELTLNFRPATANKPWKFAADTQDVRSKKVQYSKVEDSTAEYGLLFFGKPKSMPTTLAERVAMRLTTKMQEAADHGITSIHMSYLIYTPQRLVESTCLRDAVDCFCSAWTDYQSREPQGEIIALPQYGKALRSLRRALLNSDEALKTETLAAITIMGRACTLFDREHTVSIHVKGIVQLITSKGPPDINDDLDVAVCNEAHATLMPVWVYGKSVEFLTRSPWKESLDECAILHSRVQSKDWKFLSLKDAITLYGYAKGLSEDRKRFQGVYLAPVSDETKAAAASHRDHLRRVHKHIKELTARSLILGKKSGEITESPNPGGLTESRYGFCSALLAQTFQAMVTGQITILHMLIGLNAVDGDDQDMAAELKASYREASLEYWKFLPYLHELDTIVAWHFLPSVCLTWEATETDEEKEAILKMVAYMDSYLERWSKDLVEVQYAMVETAKLLTGRREDLAIL